MRKPETCKNICIRGVPLNMSVIGTNIPAQCVRLSAADTNRTCNSKLMPNLTGCVQVVGLL